MHETLESLQDLASPEPGAVTVAVLGGTHMNAALYKGASFQGGFIIETEAGPSPRLYLAETAGCPFIYVRFHGEERWVETWLALHQLGVREALGGASCGGIHPAYQVDHLAVPDDFADHNVNRVANLPKQFLENPFHQHSRLNPPMDTTLRAILTEEARRAVRVRADLHDVNIHSLGVLVQSRGGRFESVSEIRALRQAGGDLVTMNLATEIVFARQLGIHYACLSLVSNPAEGTARWDWSVVQQSFERMNPICAEIICASVRRAAAIDPDQPRSLDGQRDVPEF